MMIDFIKVFLLIGVSQVIILAGVYFMSGIFMPQLLAPVYAATGMFSRLVIALVLPLAIGNVMMAYAFALYPASWAAPLTIVFVVVLQIIFAAVLMKTKISPQLIIATLCVVGSSYWVSMLLQQKTPPL